MTQLLPDQAEGLRRLFVSDTRRMISLVGNCVNQDRSDLSAALAVALGGQGKRVLLLDENLCAGDRHVSFNVAVQQDLASILMRQADIEQAVMTTPLKVDLLAGGGQGNYQPRPALETRISLVNAFYRLAGKYDVVLVNAASIDFRTYPSFAWACHDVIVLIDQHPDSVTSVYAHIKALHQAGERRFHLLSGHTEHAVAESIYRNVAAVSRRHLKIMPDWLGMLPESRVEIADFFERLALMAQSWPLPEHREGHFPALMKRLLSGANPRVLQAMTK